MAAASLDCGCVISITTAVTTPMNPRTCADRGTAQLDGDVVPDNPTTDVFQNGYSVTAKMTAEMAQMNFQKTVQSVIQKRTLLARTSAAFLSSGSAISRMIAVMAAMKQKVLANTTTENAQSRNSNVETVNVFHRDGAVTTKTTVETTQMNWTAMVSSARTERSNANLDTVSQLTSGATEIATAEICLMKLDVLRDSLATDTVLKAGKFGLHFTLINVSINIMLPALKKTLNKGRPSLQIPVRKQPLCLSV